MLNEGIESGRFTGASRTRSQNHAVGFFNAFENVTKGTTGHTHFFDIHGDAFFVKKTNNNLFAPSDGRNSDTEVYFLTVNQHGKLTVLGNAVFIDFKGSEDFNTRNEGGGDGFGKLHDFAKDAVDAAADDKGVFERLNVNIRGFGFGRIAEDSGKSLRNRRILDDSFGIRLGSIVDCFPAALFNNVFNARNIAVVLVEDFLDALFGRHPNPNRLVDKVGKVVGGLDVGDVDHGNVEHAVFFAESNGVDAVRGVAGNFGESVLIDSDVF